MRSDEVIVPKDCAKAVFPRGIWAVNPLFISSWSFMATSLKQSILNMILLIFPTAFIISNFN